MNDATARICELERQLAIAVAAIHRAELELLGAAEDILRDRQLCETLPLRGTPRPSEQQPACDCCRSSSYDFAASRAS